MYEPVSIVERMRGEAAGVQAPAAFLLGRRSAAMALVLLAVVSCRPSEAPETYVFEGPTMGTYYRVKLVPGKALDSASQHAIQQAIEEQLERINARMSTYLDDSELSRFNAHESTDSFPVSSETWRVFQAALEIGGRTGGAFDITLGPLVDAWGFGPRRQVPAELADETIADLLDRIGLDKLDLDEAPQALRKLEKTLVCDLSGIAKGYAVDAITAVLEDLGWANFLVDVGGEVRASGQNGEGQAWRLGIERPRLDQAREIQLIVPLQDLAMATSGDYRNYYEVDGQRISHIIDPRDGRPIRHRLASVSVVHESCMIADGLATGLLVLGPEEGYRLAVEEGLAAFFLARTEEGGYRQMATPAFERLRSLPPR